MPSFKLSNNQKNAMIAEYLKNAEKGIEVKTSGEQITIMFTYGFTVYLPEIGSMISGFSEADWQNLIKEVKKHGRGSQSARVQQHVLRATSPKNL